MTTPPPIVLQVGDRVQFLAPDGRIFEGQIARAFPLQRLDGTPGPWTIFVVPEGGEEGR